MTPMRQAKKGGVLLGMVVAMVVVGALSVAMVKSLQGQAVTGGRSYNLMRARYAADSGYNYFVKLTQTKQIAFAGGVASNFTMLNEDQFSITVTTNSTYIDAKILGKMRSGGNVLATRPFNVRIPMSGSSSGGPNGVSTETYSTNDFNEATSVDDAMWKLSQDGDVITMYNQSAGKDGALLFGDTYTNFTLSVTAEVVNGNPSGGYGLYYLATIDDANQIDGYCFQFDIESTRFLVNAVNNTTNETTIAEVAMPDTKQQYIKDPHNISITVSNSFHTITVDGTPVLDFFVEVDGANRSIHPVGSTTATYRSDAYTVDDDRDESGSVGFRIWGNTKAEFTDVTVTTENTNSEGGPVIIINF
ncbi:MAG: hypothetical protein H8E68_00135 [Kiritimatiellaeota bacterium]|nr:hypothetical protein [Kiritimatiellota bacterium]